MSQYEGMKMNIAAFTAMEAFAKAIPEMDDNNLIAATHWIEATARAEMQRRKIDAERWPFGKRYDGDGGGS